MSDAGAHKAPLNPGLRAKAHENRVPTIAAPIRGSLCAFEHPRTTGDAELAWLASRQFRCLHRIQLLAAGLGRNAIGARVHRRLLTPIYRDVYALGYERPDALTLAMATVLHLRGDAVISSEFAAWLWELGDEKPKAVTATAVRFARARNGTVIHRVTTLSPADVRWRKGLPVTAPARTLLDFAACASPLEAESALAKYRRAHPERQLQEALERVPANHSGAPVIRALLALEPGELSLTKSRYERRLRQMIISAGLPPPTSNHGVEGVESDLVWVTQKLIVEFDGWETHKDKVHADKARDAKLIAAGWRVMRLTADRVDHDSLRVIAEITKALMRGE